MELSVTEIPILLLRTYLLNYFPSLKQRSSSAISTSSVLESSVPASAPRLPKPKSPKSGSPGSLGQSL